MNKFAIAVSALVLAFGIAGAQSTLPVVKAKAGQTTYVEIAQLYENDGDLGSTVKLMGVRTGDYSPTGLSEHFQAFDEGIPGGWKVVVTNTESMNEEVNMAAVQNKPHNNYACNTYGISIPVGVMPGQYALQIKVMDIDTGAVVVVPVMVEVAQ